MDFWLMCLAYALAASALLWVLFWPKKKPKKKRSPEQIIFNRYLDSVFVYLDPLSKEEIEKLGDKEPDEKFMREIEEGVGVPEQGADDFRRSVGAYIGMVVSQNGFKEPEWTCNPDLARAIEAYIVLQRP